MIETPRSTTLPERLLRDLLFIFAQHENSAQWLPIIFLVPSLRALRREWQQMNGGRGLNAYILAKHLRLLDIAADQRIWNYSKRRSGYYASDLLRALRENFPREVKS